MATKTISIKEDVYNRLVRVKRLNESFSDLLDRLALSNNSEEILNQIRGSIDLDDKESFINEVRERRKEWR